MGLNVEETCKTCKNKNFENYFRMQVGGPTTLCVCVIKKSELWNLIRVLKRYGLAPDLQVLSFAQPVIIGCGEGSHLLSLKPKQNTGVSSKL